MSKFLYLIVGFILGALVVWWSRRQQASKSAQAPAKAVTDDPACVQDDDLDAAIIEYISSNEVYHINDVCHGVTHPKGARFVRAHFHKLMEEGKIRYINSRYTI